MSNIQHPLNILQVNTIDATGGAARTAWNLSQIYHQRGYHSWLAVGQKNSTDPDVFRIPNDASRNIWARLWLSAGRLAAPLNGRLLGMGYFNRIISLAGQPRRYMRRSKGLEDFDFPGTGRLLSLALEKPDIVHGHNLHGGYFDLRALPMLSQRVPVVLTLHDAWLLSGHCAHSLDCELWQTGCGECPDLTTNPAIRQDATAENWQLKKAIYAQSKLFVSTPSRWLMRKVEQSILAPAIMDARIIPNGIDLNIFHPGERRQARAVLDIPQNAKVLLAVGYKLRSSRWRDYLVLENAVKLLPEKLSQEKISLICLGEKGETEKAGDAEVRFVDYQTDLEVVARFYQAADVYIHASRADTFPTTVLEAMACGTPVVATAVGGIPEQVDDGVTGFLTPLGDAAAMAERIGQLLRDDELRKRMGFHAAESARQRFSLERQVDDFLKWYNEILEYWHREHTVADNLH